MRLNPEHVQHIQYAATEAFGAESKVWLFGSRVDDQKKGGDIDLLVRPSKAAADHAFARKIRMLTLLERTLGERKIDLIVEAPGDTRPIIAIAHSTGVQIQ